MYSIPPDEWKNIIIPAPKIYSNRAKLSFSYYYHRTSAASAPRAAVRSAILFYFYRAGGTSNLYFVLFSSTIHRSVPYWKLYLRRWQVSRVTHVTTFLLYLLPRRATLLHLVAEKDNAKQIRNIDLIHLLYNLSEFPTDIRPKCLFASLTQLVHRNVNARIYTCTYLGFGWSEKKKCINKFNAINSIQSYSLW